MMQANPGRCATAALHATMLLAAAAGTLHAQAPSGTPTEAAISKAGPEPSAPPPVGERARHQAEKLYIAGARAVEHNDLESALTDFSKAVKLDPANRDYFAAEQLARANLVTQLIQQADKAQTLGHLDEARAKLLEAARIDPGNPSVLQHLDPASGLGAIAREDTTDALNLAPPIALAPDSSRHSFHMRGSGQELLQKVLAAYGITPTVDASVDVRHTSFDGDDLDYAQAAELLQYATNSFFVTLDPKRVLVAKDTKANRTEFERQAVETVYLPGLSSTELTDVSNIARTLFDAPNASVQPSNNTLTVKGPQAKLAALNRTLADLLDGRSQVDLEVRIIEIDTSKTTNIGVQAPQQFTAFNAESEIQKLINSNESLVQEVISSGLAPAGDLAAIVAVLLASGQVTDPLLSGNFTTFGNGLSLTGLTIPSVTANLALNSSKTKMLEDVHLRVQDQGEGDVKIGEKYPIETSSYSGLTSSSVSIPGISTAGLSSELAALGLGGTGSTQAPIPQVQYQDIGLELRVTPHILRSSDVDLTLDVKLQALAGAAVNNIPELTNRQFTSITTAKNGQSAVFVSDLTNQESYAVSGVPGLSQLPGFQSTTDTTKTTSTTSLLVIITPRVVRREHTEVAGPSILLPPHQ